VIAAEDRCYDADHAEFSNSHCADPPGPRHHTNHEPLSAEIHRGEALRRLRLGFTESLRTHHLSAPVGAFERWHFGWLLCSGHSHNATHPLDPLLPAAAAPEADQALVEELEEGGCAKRDEATRVAVGALREAADAEAVRLANDLAGRLDPDPEGLELRPAEGGAGGSGSGTLSHLFLGSLMPTTLKISNEWLGKLRVMHAAARGEGAGEAGEEEEEARFRLDLARLLLRYKAIGGSGFQAALGGGAFAVLRSCFGTTLELFASPLNARAAPYCSAFPDTDRAFGSLGSFLAFRPASGAFEANPPFVPLVVDAMCAHFEALLSHAESANSPLLFAVVVGASAALRRHAAWGRMLRLAGSAFGRARWDVALQKHGYTEGHAHICKGGAREARRMSSCDSAVFIWATEAGAVKWPPTEAAEVALRAAMRATVPRNLRKASKANKAAHAAKKEKKRQRQGQCK